MTQEIEITPLSSGQMQCLLFILNNVKNDNYSMYEAMYIGIMLSQNGYITAEDYSLKVAIKGERGAFIEICEEVIWFK